MFNLSYSFVTIENYNIGSLSLLYSKGNKLLITIYYYRDIDAYMNEWNKLLYNLAISIFHLMRPVLEQYI